MAINQTKQSNFTDEELRDIQTYECFITNPNVNKTIKDKLKLTPPPKYDLYKGLRNCN